MSFLNATLHVLAVNALSLIRMSSGVAKSSTRPSCKQFTKNLSANNHLKVYDAWFFHEPLYSSATLLLLHWNVKAARSNYLKSDLVKGHIWITSDLDPLHPLDGVVQGDFQPDQLDAVRSVACLEETWRHRGCWSGRWPGKPAKTPLYIVQFQRAVLLKSTPL